MLFPIRDLDGGTMQTNWVMAVCTAEDGAPLPVRENWQGRGPRGRCLEALEGFSIPELDVHALIGATEEVWEFPMCDREPLPRWSHGRVTLLGDAAHPMYPFACNGSAQAMVDGRALAPRRYPAGRGRRRRSRPTTRPGARRSTGSWPRTAPEGRSA